MLALNDCGYSNSIYTVESGYDGKILDRVEIVEIMGLDEAGLEKGLSVLENIVKRKFPFQGGGLRNMSVQTVMEDLGHTL